MNKFVFICGGFKIAIICKTCPVFSLKKAMRNSTLEFVFENVWDKSIFVL